MEEEETNTTALAETAATTKVKHQHQGVKKNNMEI